MDVITSIIGGSDVGGKVGCWEERHACKRHPCRVAGWTKAAPGDMYQDPRRDTGLLNADKRTYTGCDERPVSVRDAGVLLAPFDENRARATASRMRDRQIEPYAVREQRCPDTLRR